MKNLKICITLLIILSFFAIPGMAANTASSGDLINKGMPTVTTIPVTTSSVTTPLATQVTAAATPISTASGKVLNITSTTTVLLDPLRAIGGDRVKVISVTDPVICPHLQSDIIPGRIQINKDIIAASDLYVSFNNSSMDKGAVQAVTKFVATNYNRQITWTTPRSSYLAWNTPTDARKMVGEVKNWLIAADPADTAYFESNYNTYLAQIDGSDISPDLKAINQKTDVIVMEWQRQAAEKWLGLHIVDVYNPQSSDPTVHTPKDLADLINADPEKYRNVSFVIENMQTGEIAKGVEEALQAKGINAKRIVFTNFPESLSDVSSIPDVLAHNRDLVKTEQAARIEGSDVEPVSLNQASDSSNGSPTVQIPTVNSTASATALQTTGTGLPLTNLSNSSPQITTSATTNTTGVTTAPLMTVITTATVPVSTANRSAVPTTTKAPGFSWALALLGVGVLLISRLR